MQTDSPGSLRDKFGDFGAAPSAGLWDSISTSLDQDKKRRGAFWWWMLGSAAVLAVLFTVYEIGYNAGLTHDENNIPVVSNTDQGNVTEPDDLADRNSVKNTPGDEPQRFAQDTDQAQPSVNGLNLSAQSQDQSSRNQTHHSAGTSNKNDQYKANEEQYQPGEIVIFDPHFADIAMPEDEGINKLSRLPITGSNLLPSVVDPVPANMPPVKVEKEFRPNQWEIGFSLSSHTSGKVSMQQGDLAEYVADTTASPFTQMDLTGDYEAKVYRPVVAELTVTRSFGRRWAVQSGLGIAFPSSVKYFNIPDNTSLYGNAAGLETVKSRYAVVHIPLHFTFDFLKRRRVECYTGLGVNNEFPLYQKEKAEYDPQASNALESLEVSKKFHPSYQGSLQYSLGFRFCANEKLKFDLRPNVRYYFKESNALIPAVGRAWPGLTAGVVWVL